MNIVGVMMFALGVVGLVAIAMAVLGHGLVAAVLAGYLCGGISFLLVGATFSKEKE